MPRFLLALFFLAGWAWAQPDWKSLFDGKALVSGVKALIAHIHGDPAWARVKPPLAPFAAAEASAAAAGYDGVRAKRVA